MKPLTLTMRAFGPFPNEERIDFTAMGHQPFFLIHGPTGAGKTTILDAICFALYGDASGSARDPKFMRAKGAKPDTVCEVEFLFDVGGRRYCVKRQPQQILPGTGRERKHEVEFSEVDGDRNVLGDRLGKVGDVKERVERLLGFTSEQFRQVVVLPQGEFRNLLHADSAEKEKVLRRLFGTRVYERVEEILKEKRAHIQRALEDLAKEQRGRLSAWLEGVDHPTVEMLEEETRKLEHACAQLTKTHKAKRAEHTAAEAALGAGRQLESLFTQLEAATAQHKELADRRAEMTANKQRVEAGRRAHELADLEAKLGERQRELQAAQDEAKGLAAHLATKKQELEELEPQVAALKKKYEKVAEWTREQTKLEARLEQVTTLAAKQDEARKSAEAAAALEKLALESENTRAAAVAEKSRLDKESKQLAKRLASAKLADGKEANLRLEARVGLEKDSATLATVRRECEVLGRQVATLETEVKDTRAALLASSLIDGKPCPVCGSRAHPHPADSTSGRKGPHTAEALVKDLEGAQKRLQEREGEKHRLEGQIQTATKQLGKSAALSVEALRTEFNTILSAERDHQQAVEELERKQREQDRLHKQWESMDSAARSAAARSSGESSHATTLAKAVLDLSGKLGKGESDPEALRAEIAAIRLQIDEVNQQWPTLDAKHRAVVDEIGRREGERKKVVENEKRLGLAVTRVSQEFSTRIAKAGFASLKAYQSAKVDEDELHRLVGHVEEFEKEMTEAAGRLKAAREPCDGRAQPDCAALEAGALALEKESTTLGNQAAALKSQVAERRKALVALARDAAASRKLDESYQRLDRLANVALGTNKQRISLQRFVLASLLDDVVGKASERLRKMSRGRYRLQRETEAIDGRKGAGLDLRVLDEFSGETRPVKTLSGGETFLASLSLALGLADVVVSGSHGRYLETLFIDEGFGSLDTETLDTAMNTLVALHQSGRMIGVISHVGELTERIQNRIEVVQKHDRSEIRVVAAAV